MEPLNLVGKWLITLGLVLVAAGLALVLWDKLPLGKIPLGRLPGDIIIKKPGFTFYFPWVTGLVISVILSLLYYLLKK